VDRCRLGATREFRRWSCHNEALFNWSSDMKRRIIRWMLTLGTCVYALDLGTCALGLAQGSINGIQMCDIVNCDDPSYIDPCKILSCTGPDRGAVVVSED
jgi:hypothetical protein